MNATDRMALAVKYFANCDTARLLEAALRSACLCGLLVVVVVAQVRQDGVDLRLRSAHNLDA